MVATAGGRGRQCSRPGSALIVTIVVAGLCLTPCGCRRADHDGPPIPSASVGLGELALEIRIFPGEREVVRDLDRPVVVVFSSKVESGAFSFRIAPDPGGWESAWHGSGQRVELQHREPFRPETEYLVEVAVAPGHRKAVRFTAQRPSTLELISAAEAAGDIDLDTAWTYRLQRIFQPGRLPERYRSDVPMRCGTPVLRGFDRVRDRLRPGTLDALQPYLVRPDDPRRARFVAMHNPLSRFARAFLRPPRAVYALLQGEEEDRRPEVTPEWDSVDCDSAPVRFWAPRAYTAHAREGCRHLQRWNMYRRFTDLMTREPGEDTYLCAMTDNLLLRQACVGYAGGDSRIDFYLVPAPRLDDDGGACRSVNPEDRHSPQWIEIDRDLSGDDLAATIAHELFHAFQSAWDDWEDSWWQEATATWAEEYTEPSWNTEEDLRLVFDDALNMQRTLNLEDGDHEYAVYLFPYYLEKIRPGSARVIADIWKACEGKDSLKAIDAALGGRFDTTFKDFAVVNLDYDPYEDRYPQPLDLYGYHKIFKWSLDSIAEMEVEVQHALPPLAASYDIIYNKLDPNVTPLVRFRMDDFATNDKLFLHAIIYSGPNAKEEDWSNRPERVFCINRDEEQFESIVLVSVSAERETSYAYQAVDEGGADEGVISPPTITVSAEREPCRPTGGSGEFTIEKERRTRTSGPTYYHFTERVTGQITFEPFDRKNGEFEGRANVHLVAKSESHRPTIDDEFITTEGSGEVGCVLSYPWGNEDADYSLNCESLPVLWQRRTIDYYTNRPEVTEDAAEKWTSTDIDDWCIASHTGGKPKRYQLDLSGTYHDEKSSEYGSWSETCTWTIRLKPPERR